MMGGKAPLSDEERNTPQTMGITPKIDSKNGKDDSE